MHGARASLFVCAGILCLAVAYHPGATNANAQAPWNPVVAVTDGWVYAANGDAYQCTAANPYVWTCQGNVFGSGGPVSSSQPSWGQVKARYATPMPGRAAKPTRQASTNARPGFWPPQGARFRRGAGS
jgi:hypothetical protein